MEPRAEVPLHGSKGKAEDDGFDEQRVFDPPKESGIEVEEWDRIVEEPVHNAK
jgi:hypothetical protein